MMLDVMVMSLHLPHLRSGLEKLISELQAVETLLQVKESDATHSWTVAGNNFWLVLLAREQVVQLFMFTHNVALCY